MWIYLLNKNKKCHRSRKFQRMMIYWRDQTWLCVYCWCQIPDVVSPRRVITRVQFLGIHLLTVSMMTSSKGNIFRVTGHLCGEFTGDRWISRIKASDTELWCFLWSTPWIIGWVNDREAGDLRLHRGHYDVILMRTLYAFSRDWSFKIAWSLHWRHNEEDSGSNHWGLEYLLNRLFRRRSRKTSNLRVTGGLPSQRASNADMFPFDDVVMLWNMISPITYAR